MRLLKSLRWYFFNLITCLILAVGLLVLAVFNAFVFIVTGLLGQDNDPDLDEDEDY